MIIERVRLEVGDIVYGDAVQRSTTQKIKFRQVGMLTFASCSSLHIHLPQFSCRDEAASRDVSRAMSVAWVDYTTLVRLGWRSSAASKGREQSFYTCSLVKMLIKLTNGRFGGEEHN